MADEILNIDGTKIAFTRVGNGTPMVLLHGYPLDRTIWSAVRDGLQDEFELILPDMRGFGDSDVMEAGRSIIEYASDIAGLLKHLRIRKAHIVGHSMGGYVALAFARVFPSRVGGLGLVATQVQADSEERKAGRQATARQILKEGIQDVVEDMAPKLAHSAGPRDAVAGIIARQRPAGLAVALDAMAGRPDSADVLRSFRGPVVIIHGAADELIPVERALEMHRLKPAAHYLELPDVGHMPMLEDAAAVAAALRYLGPVKRSRVTLLKE